MVDRETSYDRILKILKSHRYVSILLFVGAAVIALGSFTDSINSISNTISFLQERRNIPLVQVIVSNIKNNEVQFSVSNGSGKETFELTSIFAQQLYRVDLCRNCFSTDREYLNLNLWDLNKKEVLSNGVFELSDSQLFGDIGTIVINMKESYPFSLIVDEINEIGSVFILKLDYHVIGSGLVKSYIPPIIFYVGGPPDFRKRFIKVFDFDDWPENEEIYIRQDLVTALSNFPDIRSLELLRQARNDPNAHVRESTENVIRNWNNRSLELRVH